MNVGDIVEVIKALDVGEDEWVGRQLVVKEIRYVEHYTWVRTGQSYAGKIVITVPTVTDMFPFNHGWVPEQLRVIRPPDWEAEKDKVAELVG